MALMETHYFSNILNSNVTLNVFVPTPGSGDSYLNMNQLPKYNYEEGLPVLYLLHGAYGDAFSWLRYSNIDRYAQERGIVCVMCSAENSFYQNLKGGLRYFDFFTQELPVFIQNVFPVSKDRSRTYVAGFSMGGYGAWYLGLKCPELYAKAAAMSGALDIEAILKDPVTPVSTPSLFPLAASFADILDENGIFHAAGSQYDLLTLYDQDVAKGLVPKLYQAVGYDDFLYQGNQKIKAEMEKRGADLVYEEGAGAHDWDFWDTYIKHVLDWVLEK